MQFYKKHKRIFAFLFAFLLIFNIVFVNLSYALFPNLPQPDENGIKMLVLTSLSLGLLPESLNNNVDWDSVYTYLCDSWYNTLSYAEKIEVLYASESNNNYYTLSSSIYQSLAVAVLGFIGELDQSYSFANITIGTHDYAIPITVLSNSNLDLSSNAFFHENAYIDLGNTIPFMSYSGSPDNNIYSQNFEINLANHLMSDSFESASASNSWASITFSKNLLPFINVYGNFSFLRYYNSEDQQYHWAIDNKPPIESTYLHYLFVIDYIARPLNRYASKMYFVIQNNEIYGITNFYELSNNLRFSGQYIHKIDASITADYSSSANNQTKSPFGSYLLQNVTTLDLPAGVSFSYDDLSTPAYSTYVDGTKQVVITSPDNFDISNIEDYSSADTNIVFPVPNNPALSGVMEDIEAIHDEIITQANFGDLTDIYEQNKSLLNDLSSNDLSWLILASNSLFSHFEHFLILCCFFITVSRLIR